MRVRMMLFLVTSLALASNSLAAASAERKLDEIIAQLRAQQAEIEAQRALIAVQSDRIDRLQQQLSSQSAIVIDPRQPPPASVVPQTEVAAKSSSESAAQEKIQGDVLADKAKAPEVGSAIAESKDEQVDDPARAILESLPGAMRLPGTNAIIRWGGFVKASYVQSFDPLIVTDRFLTGVIPTSEDPESDTQEIDISVSQSRLSFDLREPTKMGLVRAYLEGDFAANASGFGNDDLFRLRHAFGQTGNVLVGKTWSGMVDRSASPEEIDFEGLNARINVRQPQLRFQPRYIGKRVEMLVSLEDPVAKVTDGNGLSKYPDLVVSGRFNFGEGIHVRAATVIRQVRARWDEDLSTSGQFGYGLSISGRIDSSPWDARDNVLFQLNVGNALGRYVKDLDSVGDFDGVFSPDGELKLIDVVAGYVGAQHWWTETMRSTATLGFVDLDNPEFVEGDFYKRTLRASANLMWSPTPRSTVGGELLWGRRETEDGASGNAGQFQFAVKYLF